MYACKVQNIGVKQTNKQTKQHEGAIHLNQITELKPMKVGVGKGRAKGDKNM